MSANKLEVQLSADIVQFERGIKEAKRSLKVYTGSVGKTEKAQASLNKQIVLSRKQMANYGRGLTKVAGIATAAFAGAAAGAVAHTRAMADQAREFERQATVAQVSVEQIQALGYATEQYNISGDKMADMLKDVNDKLGDYAATGGGGFKDFFEEVAPKVGLTVDELQRMAGPEALVAVKSAMDRANVPMKQQIFYLESIANDASALLPLLDKQGQKLYELTGKYEDLNVSMSEYDIEQFKELDQKLIDIELKLKKSFSNAVLGSSKQIDGLIGQLSKAMDYWGALFDSMNDAPRTEAGILAKKGRAVDDARTARIELERAQKQLDDLLAAQKNAVGNVEIQARLANSGFSGRVEQAETKVQKLKQEYEALQKLVDKYQHQYNRDVLGVTEGGDGDPPTKVVNQVLNPQEENEDRRVTAFRDATKKMEVEWQRRLALYAAGDQKEATQEAFAYQDKLARLKQSFQTAHDAASADRQLQQELESEHFAARELLWQEHQENLSRIESEQLLLREEQNRNYWDRYLESVQENMTNMDEITAGMLNNFSAGVGNAFESMVYDSESLGDAFGNLAVGMGRSVVNALGQMAGQWLAYQAVQMSVGKATATASATAMTANAQAASLQAGLNAFAATAAIPIVGPAAAPAAMTTALAVTEPVALSIGALAAGGIAGMAHSGISSIPEEGTWLLNKGERVYTNESANQLDQMFKAIMATHRQPNAINNPGLAYQNQLAASGRAASTQPWQIVINEAPAGTSAEIDDEKKIINIMMKDANSSGQYISYISQKLGVKPGGYK